MGNNVNIKNEYIVLGGIKQSILTLCTDKNNPVLLILHGGPGSPDRPLICTYNIELANYFTVVCWDQRCSGLSYTKQSKKEELSIELVLSDLKELVEYITKTYKKEKIYLAGHSWGAYIGVRFSHDYPQHIKYYIGTGQGISSFVDEQYKYDFVKSEALKIGDEKSLKTLNGFGNPINGVYSNDNKKAKAYVGELVHKYGGYIHPGSSFNMKSYLSIYIRQYGFNAYKVVRGISYSLKFLSPQMNGEDKISNIKSLTVPILLISGERDFVCPVDAVTPWLKSLSAPEKKLVVIKDAAHMVNFEKARQWNELVINLIK